MEVRALGWRVIVIDDGSTDGTFDEAQTAGATVIKHATNQGKGAAICTAARQLIQEGYPAAVFMDADGQHRPDEIHRLVDCYVQTRADLVIGCRSDAQHHMPAYRLIANRSSSWCISRAAGRPIRDSQSGFRLLSETMLRDLAQRPHRSARFELESAMIIDAVRAGRNYQEVEISCVYLEGRVSHYRAIRDSLRITWVLITRLFRGLLQSKHPVLHDGVVQQKRECFRDPLADNQARADARD